MITLPVVLIAAAVLLLLALLLGLFLQRRRAASATPPGPRTVADLVQQRADRDPAPAPAPADPVERPVEEPAPAEPVTSTVDWPASTDCADPEPAALEEPSVPGPAPVTTARAIAPLGDDVPWRRAAQMSGTADADADADPAPEPEPTDAGRVPALALLRRPSRRPLPADTRHPFRPSTPRLAVVPATPPADLAAVAAPVPAGATDSGATDPGAADTERTGAELTGAELTGDEPASGSEPAIAGPTDAESSDAELNSAGPTDIESVEAESGHVEPIGAELIGAEQPGAEPAGADQADRGSTDAVPAHPEPPADEPVDGDRAGLEQAEDEQPQDVPSGAVLVGSALAVGAIVAAGAQVAARRAGDHDAEPGGVDDGAAPAEPTAGPVEHPVEGSEVVHNREIDVKGVADRPDHSHGDLVPVDGGPPEVDGSGGPFGPPATGLADDVAEPAEAQVTPDHSGFAPIAATGGLAGAAAFALTRDVPYAEPDDFPSTDPDVLFDSPPEPPAVDEPAPVAGADGDPAAEAPRTWATEASETRATEDAPAAEASTAAVEASEGPAEPGEPATAPPPAALTTVRPGPAESVRRSPRDPVHLAAEQAAADLALLRTFGDPSARPERAPIVALEGTTRPESPRPVGAAQPVRFRAVGRAGTEVAGAAVALLDDRGHEVDAGRSAAGELTAPHPGAYVLVATAPDHQPGAVALTVGDAPVDADVLLVRSAALVGVVSGEDGPLAGARVTLVQDGEVVDVAETDADGAYLVADLAAGEYAVSVAAAGCDADVVLVVVADESERVHDVELEPAGVPAG